MITDKGGRGANRGIERWFERIIMLKSENYTYAYLYVYKKS